MFYKSHDLGFCLKKIFHALLRSHKIFLVWSTALLHITTAAKQLTKVHVVF